MKTKKTDELTMSNVKKRIDRFKSYDIDKILLAFENDTKLYYDYLDNVYNIEFYGSTIFTTKYRISAINKFKEIAL